MAKSYIGEVTDETNQPKGFSIIGLTWGVGSFVGAFFGGVLARPAVQYPDLFSKVSLTPSDLNHRHSPGWLLGTESVSPSCHHGIVCPCSGNSELIFLSGGHRFITVIEAYEDECVPFPVFRSPKVLNSVEKMGGKNVSESDDDSVQVNLDDLDADEVDNEFSPALTCGDKFRYEFGRVFSLFSCKGSENDDDLDDDDDDDTVRRRLFVG